MILSETIRNSAKMLSGNAAAQVIGILFYPLLTRLYPADAFGVLNLFLSIGGVLLLLSTADYQYAIVLPKSEKKAVGVFQTAAFTAATVSFLCLVSVLFRHPIAHLFNTPELAVFYPLMPLYVSLSAAWMLLNYWFTRQKCFGIISTYQVTQNLGNSLFKYGLGKAGNLQWGLFTSTILGLAVSLSVSIATTFRTWRQKLLCFDLRQMKTAARRYARFPLFSLPRSLVNNLSGNLPFFLLTPCFGLTEMGYLGMGLTLAFRPINMVAASLYQVFFQKIAEKVQNRLPIMPFFRKFIGRTFLIVLPCFAALYFILPDLTEWLLGPGWEITGRYIRLLLPWLAMVCAVSCMSFISDIFQKQATVLVIEIAYLLLRTAALAIGIVRNDFRLAILLFSLSSALVMAGQLIWYVSLINRYEKSRKLIPTPGRGS